MRTQVLASMLIAALGGMAACGGSGSSGLDIAPASEPQAIARAIDSNVCVDFASLTFCPSAAEAPGDDFAGASVSIEAPDDPLVCQDGAASDACTASLSFTREGFVTPVSFLAAVSASEQGPWTLAAMTVVGGVVGPRTVTITVPASPDPGSPTPLIAAVLVYAGAQPDDVPQTSLRLADFGADLVYVSSRLQVVIDRSPIVRGR